MERTTAVDYREKGRLLGTGGGLTHVERHPGRMPPQIRSTIDAASSCLLMNAIKDIQILKNKKGAVHTRSRHLSLSTGPSNIRKQCWYDPLRIAPLLPHALQAAALRAGWLEACGCVPCLTIGTS